jgi:hypothetical protein
MLDPLAEPHGPGEGVDHDEALALGLGDEEAAVVGPEVQRGDRRLPAGNPVAHGTRLRGGRRAARSGTWIVARRPHSQPPEKIRVSS